MADVPKKPLLSDIGTTWLPFGFIYKSYICHKYLTYSKCNKNVMNSQEGKESFSDILHHIFEAVEIARLVYVHRLDNSLMWQAV